ncbi:hypothetical protein AUK40_05390 [Candidatus Wirthbacteria bacterium CG2_30_54_11]|uniref:EamA domain-containing protein n=1 Tax=Candidatus Wirthbacteria bacterium CG2_30_54_11 TaxID=1817892 RepID=A0A1J5IFW7_9BACT|nr:MAG: hypothetical protein AUK40_05390 [Candidatus Wirthbacteria bacterium CG2_30_54_11]
MFFLSVLAGLGVALGWGIADFAQKKLVMENGAYSMILPLQVATTALVGGVWVLFRFPVQVSFTAFCWMLAGTCLLTAAWFLFFRALSIGNVSVLCALYAFYTVIPFFWQTVVEKIQLNIVQFIGMGVVLIAGILISVDSRSLKQGFKASLSKGVKEITAALVMSGFGFLMIDHAVQEIGWKSGYIVQQMLSLLEVVVILLLLGKFRESRLPVSWGWFSTVVLANIIAFGSFNAGMEIGYVSVVGIVGTFSVAITALLAWPLLKERLAFNQYLGIAFGIVGIISLSL